MKYSNLVYLSLLFLTASFTYAENAPTAALARRNELQQFQRLTLQKRADRGHDQGQPRRSSERLRLQAAAQRDTKVQASNPHNPPMRERTLTMEEATAKHRVQNAVRIAKEIRKQHQSVEAAGGEQIASSNPKQARPAATKRKASSPPVRRLGRAGWEFEKEPSPEQSPGQSHESSPERLKVTAAPARGAITRSRAKNDPDNTGQHIHHW